MKAIRNKALELLARRDYSRRALVYKLQTKGFLVPDIEKVLLELEAQHLFDEERYIESLIRRYRSKGKGPLKVCAELKGQGISMERAFATQEWQACEWDKSARSVRIKKFGETLALCASERARQSRFLQQRGFRGADIRAAMTEECD